VHLLDLCEKGHPAHHHRAGKFHAAARRRRDDDLSVQYRCAQHTFCTTCGMHPFYVPRADPDKFSVNARCLDDYDPAAMRPTRVFDGAAWEAAYAARGRNTSA
jgi:hypothetical protein